MPQLLHTHPIPAVIFNALLNCFLNQTLTHGYYELAP